MIPDKYARIRELGLQVHGDFGATYYYYYVSADALARLLEGCVEVTGWHDRNWTMGNFPTPNADTHRALMFPPQPIEKDDAMKVLRDLLEWEKSDPSKPRISITCIIDRARALVKEGK